MWDAETGKVLHTFQIASSVFPGGWVSAGGVALGPDSKRIATPLTASIPGNPFGKGVDDMGGPVRMWDMGDGKFTKPMKEFKEKIGRVVFSPDGESLAGGGLGNSAKVWDVEAGKELAALPSPAGITAIAFSPGGKSLAGGSGDGSVRIWAMPASK